MERKELLKKIKLFVLDLDGTFYLGERLFPDSLRFISRVRASNREYKFFTNNSSKTPESHVGKLTGMGLEVSRDDVLTSGDVCIDYLKKNHEGASVFLMGTETLRASFTEAGVRLIGSGDCPRNGSNPAGQPDVVVCAFDTELTYHKLERACTYIRGGAVFLATHEDINCPTEDGFLPDCGSMCAMISLSTGRAPKYVGKPHPETVEIIESVTGIERGGIAFVGDRLYTDVACGVNNGAIGILVLSGETKPEDIPGSPVKPHAVFSGLGEIADLL